MRRITGRPTISFADRQFTCYRRGHFLSLHIDVADGMAPAAALVLNVTPRRAADCGGQLQSTDLGGRVIETIVPQFNTAVLVRRAGTASGHCGRAVRRRRALCADRLAALRHRAGGVRPRGGAGAGVIAHLIAATYRSQRGRP